MRSWKTSKEELQSVNEELATVNNELQTKVDDLSRIFARFISLWIQCKMTGAGISFPHLVMMTIRKVNPSVIVRAKITAVQAGLTDVYPISTRDLESHYLAGGNVPNVIRALVAAHRANIDLDWQTAQANPHWRSKACGSGSRPRNARKTSSGCRLPPSDSTLFNVR